LDLQPATKEKPLPTKEASSSALGRSSIGTEYYLSLRVRSGLNSIGMDSRIEALMAIESRCSVAVELGMALNNLAASAALIA